MVTHNMVLLLFSYSAYCECDCLSVLVFNPQIGGMVCGGGWGDDIMARGQNDKVFVSV